MVAVVQRLGKGSTGAVASLSIGAGDGWATPTAGNILVVSANSDATVTMTTAGFTAGPSVVDGNGTYTWYKTAAGTESTVTVTPGSSALTCMTIHELSGASLPVDSTNSSTIAGVNGTVTTSANVTTTATADFVIAYALLHSYIAPAPSAPSWSNSFSQQVTAATNIVSGACTTYVGELTAGAPGVYNTVCTWTTQAGDRQHIILAFKDTTTPTPRYGTPPVEWWPGDGPLQAERFTPQTYDTTVAVTADINANAETTTTAHDAGDATTALSVFDPPTPDISHTTADPTTTVAVTAETGTTTHTTNDTTPTTSITAGAAATAHTTENGGFGLAEDAGTTTTTHQTDDVTITLTTTPTPAANTHTTTDPTPSVAVNAADAATTHQTFDATASTAVLVSATAEDTTHAVVAGDPTPAVATPAGTTTHAQTASDALAGVGATSGHPQQAHNAGDVTAAAATTATPAATAHTTNNVTATTTTTDTVAPDITHQAFDATGSTAVLTNVNAEDTATAHTTSDATVRGSVNAEHAATTHQTHTPAPAVATPTTAATTTHQTLNTAYGLAATAPAPTHAHTTADTTPHIAATTQTATHTVEAYDAFVTTALAPIAHVAVDTGLTATTVHDSSALPHPHDSYTQPGQSRDRDTATTTTLVE